MEVKCIRGLYVGSKVSKESCVGIWGWEYRFVVFGSEIGF